MSKLIRFSALALALLTVVSCSLYFGSPDEHDSPMPSEEEYFNVTGDEQLKFEEIIEVLFSEEGPASEMTSFRGQIMNMADQKNKSLRQRLQNDDAEYGYRRVVYTYKSVDAHDKDVELSASLLWPGYFIGSEWHDLKPENICLLEHYTITSDKESPTGGYQFEPYAVGNSLFVVPDYIGYGITADMVHPYLNHNLCAINSIDALEAGFSAFCDMSEEGLNEKWKLYVLGASQGGANALAVHKYLDTNEEVGKLWRFEYSNCAAGPHSPVITMETYFESGVTTYPVLFPLVFKSYIYSYPDILGAFTEDQFYSDKYLAVKEQIDQMISGKEHKVKDINMLILTETKDLFDSSIGLTELYLSDILSPEIMDPESAIYKALLKCLEINDLTVGWTPSHPIKLYHSSADVVVPYENSLAVKEAFGTNVTITRDIMNSDHVTSTAMWMLTLMIGGV